MFLFFFLFFLFFFLQKDSNKIKYYNLNRYHVVYVSSLPPKEVVLKHIDPNDKNKMVEILPRDMQFCNVREALKTIIKYDRSEKGLLYPDWIHKGLKNRIHKFLDLSFEHYPPRSPHFMSSNHHYYPYPHMNQPPSSQYQPPSSQYQHMNQQQYQQQYQGEENDGLSSASSSGSRYEGNRSTNNGQYAQQTGKIPKKKNNNKRKRKEYESQNEQKEDTTTKKAKKEEERKRKFLSKISEHNVYDMDKDKRASYQLQINEEIEITIKPFSKSRMDYEKKSEYDKCHFYFSKPTSSNFSKLPRKNAVGLLVGIASGADGGKARLWRSHHFKKKLKGYGTRRDKATEINPDWLIAPLAYYLNILCNANVKLILKRDEIKYNKYWCITSEAEIASRNRNEIDSVVFENFTSMDDDATIYNQFTIIMKLLLAQRKEKEKDNDKGKKIELGQCEDCKNLILKIDDVPECRWDCWELGTVIVDEGMNPPKNKRIKRK